MNPPARPVDLSVVIPTFNRAKLLVLTIPALMSQETGDLTYEVLFTSNGSSDASDSILREAEARYGGRLRYFYIDPTGGPSAPRNVGIRAAAGKVVIILDDDVLPDPDLVLRHAEFHRQFPERHHAALGEAYVPPEALKEPISCFHSFPYDEVRKLDRLSYLHFWTCNISLKREYMLAEGMFDETMLYYEDMLCGYQLSKKGLRLHFHPAARGKHMHQLREESVPAKGILYGRWLYVMVQRIPDPELMKRFGILSREIGAVLLARRIFRRVMFRIVDNPLTLLGLKLLGARRAKRTRFSDFYYFLTFRRNLLAGYNQAERAVRAGRPAV